MTRYTFGGDEHLFVEFSEEMSLEANFRVTLVSRHIHELINRNELEGVFELCPANASLLLRFNPDVIDPHKLEDVVRQVEEEVTHSGNTAIETRIIEVPVWYNDPITAEVGSRFREGYHQNPEGKDLDYAAKVNNLPSATEFIRCHHESPWLVTMVGFVAGLPFMYQLVERNHQLEVPKYLSPRTDTAKLTVGHGGCFGVIYSVRGAGGYQMFGIAAADIFEPKLQGTDEESKMILFRPGDIVKFRPIDETEYQAISAANERGEYQYRIAPVRFDMERALKEGSSYNTELLEALK
ncbi:carboxyltransferase domain-containing protein [Corynebacterium poyangense]|uniref:Carboxyltransferase domain-containing protein n=1 Tax=Corynebacterium poyangense TaxID=2684405 RepID=A0A7H0SRD4_9CORY|nr:carboxyltransferase domain-containing protein [Corynebacterium poyangense]QNQ91109.1 carboxyltransferase domain-containing protein [Corynebacterium poyangense]